MVHVFEHKLRFCLTLFALDRSLALALALASGMIQIFRCSSKCRSGTAEFGPGMLETS